LLGVASLLSASSFSISSIALPNAWELGVGRA
jgi:hypothetical protein